MRIAVISTPVFPIHPPAGLSGYGGLEAIAWYGAKELAARGHEVSLFAPDGSECPGCTMVHTGPAGHMDERAAYSRYWSLLPQHDVVLDHTWNKWSMILKMEGRLQAPILSILHAPVHTMYATLPPVPKPCMVCISEDQRSHFEGLHGREARTALNGVDVDFYRSIGTARSGRNLFLARFSSVKNPLGAIQACKAAGVGLDLIGDTTITNEPAYFQQCAALCDGQQIRMVGPATRTECVAWFSQAHMLVHSTEKFREPFGLAPVEAMLCETPVVAWKYGALKETVLHGETGWLVSSQEELTEAVKHGVSDAMRKHCREWASQFSVQAMGKRYEELCVEAVTTGGW